MEEGEQSNSVKILEKSSGALDCNLLKSPPTMRIGCLRLSGDFKCLRRVEAKG